MKVLSVYFSSGAMVVPDLLFQIVAGIALIFFNAFITAFFVYRRWNLKAIPSGKRWGILLFTFLLVAAILLVLQFLLQQNFEIWLVIYTVTMIIISIGDFLASRSKIKYRQKS